MFLRRKKILCSECKLIIDYFIKSTVYNKLVINNHFNTKKKINFNILNTLIFTFY